MIIYYFIIYNLRLICSIYELGWADKNKRIPTFLYVGILSTRMSLSLLTDAKVGIIF